MVKRLTVIGAAIVLMMSVLTGCGEKYKTDGCFVYEVVTTENGEYLTEDEYYVRLRELSDYGKQQKYIIVPAELDGYSIKEIGKPHLLAGLYTQWESEVLEKIYFQGAYETGPSSFLSNCPELEKILLIVGGFEDMGFDKRSYFPHTESQISTSSSIDKQFANVTFRFNYEGSTNEGVWWIDDLDNEKIEVIPPSPEREGYEFCGWYKEPACINAWDFETDMVPAKEYTEDGEYVYKETCLYAKWQKE